MSRSEPRTDDEIKTLSAVCGLFCRSCTLYIATHEDPQRLANLARRFDRSIEEMQCDGCRSELRGPYCKICKMLPCATEKKLDFCGACDEYPCEHLKEFQKAMPHRIELWQAQKRIAEVGYAQWYRETLDRYTCPECKTVNSVYDIQCRKCGCKPGCSFVADHLEVLESNPVKLL